MNREYWLELGESHIRAFEQIARVLGMDHTITKMLGSLAWGRCEIEPVTSRPTLRYAITRNAYLSGYFAAVNVWARDNAPSTQRTILDIWTGRL